MSGKRRAKKGQPTGRPPVPATHGRDRVPLPRPPAVKPTHRPGHGMR